MSPLFKRILWSQKNLKPVKPKYTIMWEDPKDLEAPVKFKTPAPEWLAMALHGDLLPPIEAYLRDRENDYKQPEHPYADPVGPMTEEEAIEYLCLKELPLHVLNYQGNRTILKIVPIDTVPRDKTWRSAWKINQMEAAHG